jgi:glycolate oxidase FAD binding subunit
VLRGGGKVVKNAAGFSLQHAFLGSLGRLSVLTEVTFKVFPRAPAMLTIVLEFDTFARALDALVKLRRSTFELEAVDLLPTATLIVRLGGLDEMLKARAASLVAFLMPGEVNLLPQAEADAEWHGARQFAWLAGAAQRAGQDEGGGYPLVKVGITPGRIVKFEERLAAAVGGERVPRRYSAGGEVAWIGWPGSIEALDRLLKECELSGLVLTQAEAVTASPLIGVQSDTVFSGRLREAFDPRGIFA